MPQSIFTAGNPISSRLKLGIVPDGTTNASCAVWRPDGTTVGTTAPSAWFGPDGDEKTVQWYATDDGTAGAATDNADGDWLAVWTVTGTGATTAAKVYSVLPLPGTGTRPDWSPFLSHVADHVPFLTESASLPGQVWLGTFTGDTAPTDEQAQRHVDAAVATLAARVGTIPAALYPLARAVAAARAAASILRAFARTDEARTAADALDLRADASLGQLVDAAESAGSVASVGPGPVGYFPAAKWYGDFDL